MTGSTRNRHDSTRRTCLFCQVAIPEQRPVFLVGHPSGRIVGPFHAGCAERMVLAARKRMADPDHVIGESFGSWPSRREETMPW